MNSTYKLIYFNLSGRGEPIRMLLSYGGIAFEDKRVEFDDWPKVQPTTPLRQLPVLEIDGKSFTQTIPLCKYLGNMLGIDGQDRSENYAIDAAVEIIWDLLLKAYERKWETSESRKDEIKAKISAQLPISLGKLEEDAKKNGYIAINRITWADIVFLCAYEDLENLWEKPFENFPNLRKLKEKILEHKKLRDYIKKRPTNQYLTKYNLKNEM